ncbi:hypothetical protein ACH0B5_15285 [Ureibacillus sp. 179-F W5.1 NHS]
MCEKEIDLEKKGNYEYDNFGDLWCKGCMEEEMNREIDLEGIIND